MVTISSLLNSPLTIFLISLSMFVMLKGYLWLGVMKAEEKTIPSYSGLEIISLKKFNMIWFWASSVLAKKNTSPCIP
jgi:hypothetical protein